MTRVIILTEKSFIDLALTPGRIRYVNTELSDAGYHNICLDSFGDWVAISETPDLKAGTVHTIGSVIGKQVVEAI